MEKRDELYFDSLAIPGKPSELRLVKKGNDFTLLYHIPTKEFWIANVSIPYWRSNVINSASIAKTWNALEPRLFTISENWLLIQLADKNNVENLPRWTRPTLADIEIGAYLVVAYSYAEDHNMIHMGEDYPVELSDMGVGDALEISYKPRLKPMKKMRGPKLNKFRKVYRKTKLKRKQKQRKWRLKNRSQIKRRAKMRHYKKRA
jgi:hypothetical protein